MAPQKFNHGGCQQTGYFEHAHPPTLACHN